jgi:hypothetical protein
MSSSGRRCWRSSDQKALGAALLGVYGTWQCEGEVRQLVAQRLVDMSHLLGGLTTGVETSAELQPRYEKPPAEIALKLTVDLHANRSRDPHERVTTIFGREFDRCYFSWSDDTHDTSLPKRGVER